MKVGKIREGLNHPKIHTHEDMSKKENWFHRKGHVEREKSYEWRDHSTCNLYAKKDIPKRHMEMNEVVICEFWWRR